MCCVFHSLWSVVRSGGQGVHPLNEACYCIHLPSMLALLHKKVLWD